MSSPCRPRASPRSEARQATSRLFLQRRMSPQRPRVPARPVGRWGGQGAAGGFQTFHRGVPVRLCSVPRSALPRSLKAQPVLGTLLTDSPLFSCTIPATPGRGRPGRMGLARYYRRADSEPATNNYTNAGRLTDAFRPAGSEHAARVAASNDSRGTPETESGLFVHRSPGETGMAQKSGLSECVAWSPAIAAVGRLNLPTRLRRDIATQACRHGLGSQPG